MHNCKCNIIIICVSMCLCQSTCSSGQLVVLWPDGVSCRDIRIRIWSRWWSSSTWPLRPPRNTAAGKSTGNHSETKRRPVPACTQRHVLHGIKRQSSWTIQTIQRQHARMILTMNINDNKSSQSHPGPHLATSLSPARLYQRSEHYSVQHKPETHAWHTFWPAPLNQICSECVCVRLQEECCSVWRRYFAGPEDTGRTDHDLTRPQQHPLLPGHLNKQNQTHMMCWSYGTRAVFVCWLYLWKYCSIPCFMTASDCSSALCFNLQQPLLDHA